MTTTPDEPFRLGDVVTRDGSDLHEVIEEDEGWNAMRVRCIKAPKTGWAAVGDEEFNLVGRYHLVERAKNRTPE